MQFKLIIGLLLTPFSLIFGCVAAFRRFLYRNGILSGEESPVPAIDIGNLAVGGTGKTPHTQYVIDLLKNEFHVAALSRGYGRKSEGYHSILQTEPENRNAEIFGDEPFMTHLRFPELPLAVDGDRSEGVRNLLDENPETEVVVLDDAYQHLSFKPTFHILLTEYDRPFRPDMPMPAGKLREFSRASRFADVVIVTKVPENANTDELAWRHKLRLQPQQELFFTRFRYEQLRPVTAAAHNRDLETVKDVVVLTGIAHPKPLLRHLEESYQIVAHHDFPDHHTFTEKEIQSIYDQHFNNIGKQVVLVTTEKDWMRMQSEHIINIVSLLPVFVIPVEVEFLTETQRDTFNQRLKDHVRGKEKKS
ncbi:MAG: tetraacyldisaccharide 4'-kinase [Bacteroidales bacterium]|nr:tetraacyldisaccharide 4'-kinase [Bacteroidales bacterium]